MGTEITLTIPDYIYQQAKQIADADQRPVADVINDVLVDVFPSVHVHPQREQMEQELEAFHRHFAHLSQEYPAQYVAVHGGKVVDHDADRISLVMRIDENFPNVVVLIRQVNPEPEKIIHMRSPRFVK